MLEGGIINSKNQQTDGFIKNTAVENANKINARQHLDKSIRIRCALWRSVARKPPRRLPH